MREIKHEPHHEIKQAGLLRSPRSAKGKRPRLKAASRNGKRLSASGAKRNATAKHGTTKDQAVGIPVARTTATDLFLSLLLSGFGGFGKSGPFGKGKGGSYQQGGNSTTKTDI